MEYLQKDAEFIPLGSGEPRSTDTVHLTDVMKSLEEDLDIGYKGDGFQDKFLTMEIGFWWEDVLEFAFGERSAIRVGEVECDGIVGSPDGVNTNPGWIDDDGIVLIEPSDKLILEEYKCTWKSARSGLNNVWKYMTQTKSYCHMVGTNVVIFKVCYLMGFYKGDGPVYREAYITYTDEELENNWNMIITHAKEKGMI